MLSSWHDYLELDTDQWSAIQARSRQVSVSDHIDFGPIKP